MTSAEGKCAAGPVTAGCPGGRFLFGTIIASIAVDDDLNCLAKLACVFCPRSGSVAGLLASAPLDPLAACVRIVAGRFAFLLAKPNQAKPDGCCQGCQGCRLVGATDQLYAAASCGNERASLRELFVRQLGASRGDPGRRSATGSVASRTLW